MPRRIAALSFALILPLFAQEPLAETLLLQDPSASREHVVFAYAEDIWVVSREGGVAQRLTSSLGTEATPRLSPDGRWVAFTGEYEGNLDVYVIPVTGGAPRRLTWHPGTDRVRGWHPDGKRILFTSGRLGGAPVERLFLVPADGGWEEPLDLPKVWHAAYNEDATRIAYTPIPDAFRTWKRYRGGRIPPVWIYDIATHEVEQVPHEVASDTFPCWLGGDVYFASDRDGHMNIWKYRPGSYQVEQVTRFADFDVRNMTAGGGVLAFERAGAVHLLGPASGEVTRLRVSIVSDDLSRLPRWEEVKGSVRDGAIAPNGKRAVFEARGEILSVPKEHGDARNLSESPGAHDRTPVWSPDGKQVAWLSDRDGEYRLLVRDQLGREEPKAYDLGSGGFFLEPSWSPDGKHVLFQDKGNLLAYLTLESGKVTEVARCLGTLGVFGFSATWSPDSKWIAFLRRDAETAYDRVCLYELEGARTAVLTHALCSAGSPAFSRDGKHLFFTASVESGPRRFGLDMSASAARPSKSRMFVVVLRKDGKNPLEPKSDEAIDDKKPDVKKKDDDEKKDEDKPEDKPEDEPEDKPEDKKEDKKEEKQPEGPSADLEGIEQRILGLPVGAGQYSGLECAKTVLLYIETGEGDAGSELKSFSFDDRKPKSVAKDGSGFRVSADGKSLLVRSKEEWSIMTADGKDKKVLGVGGVKVRVDPAQEWPQILREVWRIQRDYFYDPGMHGVDWKAMWDRWSAFLPHVRHRSDLNLVIAEMMGELCCGHEYVDGGAMPEGPKGASVGLLGADVEVADGKYRISRIYRGQNWDAELRSPLTEPGVDAREGDYVVSVNGVPLAPPTNFYAAFAELADNQVELVLSAKPDGSEPRTVKVVPLSKDGPLRQQAWVEANRRRVTELSGGRLAYVYMPDTGGEGLESFTRDWFSQVDRQGVVLDERYNRGGKVADYVIDVLSRDVMCYWFNREGWLARTPFGTIQGPKVMVVNERAGSGGDAMPWMFQHEKLGPLVGTRTWGGLVGISGYPTLMDGGSVTSACFGIVDPEGSWVVENVGVTPDHEVIEWPKEVIAGHDPQLEKAIAVAMEMLEKAPPPKRPEWKPPTPR